MPNSNPIRVAGAAGRVGAVGGAFAEQFDPLRFHLDTEAAKATLLRELVSSGWHTAAITMQLLVENGLPIAGGLIGAGGEITWPYVEGSALQWR